MSRLNTGTESSRGASQKPVVATIVYSRAEPSITRRPSHSHAHSITATPPHSSSDDNTSPWPKRSQDRCSDSSSGSCSRVLPAPSPPAVISTAPRKPSSAGRASGEVVNADSRAKLVTGSSGPVGGQPGELGKARLCLYVDRCGTEGFQRPPW